MDCYEIWCDLRPGVRDAEFVSALQGFLGHMQGEGKIESFRVRRRKLGFGPDALGEWNVSIEVRDLAQLDLAFAVAAKRSGEVETLHREVFSRVANLKFGLYRDFPDQL